MTNLYNSWVVSKKYAATETAALTSGNKIEYVRIITSDDKFAQSDLKNFTDLVLTTIKVRQSLPVSSVTIKENVVTVTAIATSTGNAQDYDVNTALMVCRYNGIEFMAAAVTAITPQRVPAEGEQEKTEFTIRPQFTLSNADTVSTVVDPVTAATNERVDTEVMNLQTQIDAASADRKSIWDKIASLVDLATNQTITGVKTFSKTIIGSISGNAGTATKLQISRTLSLSGDATGSKDFDGSADSTIPVTLANVAQNNTTSSGTATYGSQIVLVDDVSVDTKGRQLGLNKRTVTLPAAYVHPSPNRTDTSTAENPNNGSSFTVVDRVTSDNNGHVTAINLKTVTMPIQNNVNGNAGTATKLQTAVNINGVKFDGTSNINVNVANDAQLLRYAADSSVTRPDGVVLFDKDGNANGTINGKAFINVKNNWAVSYRKLGNRVQLRVISCDGITKDSATIATLPQEARPDQIIYSQAGRNVTRGAIEFFAISSNGDIYYQSGQYDPALTDKHDLVVEYTV